MADPDRLTLAFMRAHPAEAARVLERLPMRSTGALLEAVPARVAAPVLAEMLPTTAARLIESLDDVQGIGILAALTTHRGIAVLRHVSEPRQSRLIGGLPATMAVASRLLLGYPTDAVGAWVEPDVVTLTADTRVADALERVREQDTARADMVYVITTDGRLTGVAPLERLLRAPSDARLAEVASPPAATLAAATPLGGAAGYRGWQLGALLPVVERDGHLIGVLHRSTLQAALARSRRATDATRADAGVASVAAAGYWHAVSGLIGAFLALLPTVRPVAENRDER